jgi:inosine-uridine nucleoside N-ribohydrolase
MVEPIRLASLIALAVPLGCAAPAALPPRPVILTTDAGCEVDDQWALAHLLLLHDEGAIDLLGIVTTHAPNLKPPAAETSAAVAREVIAVLKPRSPPPVVAGGSVPLESIERPRHNPGAETIVEASRMFGPERRLTVIAIGAATDVASALLLDPRTAERVEVVAMGFEGWPRGGDPWNVKNDSLAYRVLLASGVPLVIGAADVCVRHLTLDEEAAREKTTAGGSAGDYLQGLLRGWLEHETELCRQYTGRRAWPIWDMVTVAYVLGLAPAEERPRPRLLADLTFDLENDQGKLRWVTGVDEEGLWDDFSARLRRWKMRQGSAEPH